MPRFFAKNRRFQCAQLLLAAASLACTVSGSGALAQHPKRHDQYKHQIEALEQTWRDAQLKDDVDAMDKLLSDDYVGITMSGQVVTKEQQLDRMRQRNAVLSSIHVDDMKVKVHGSTAVVTALAQVEGTDEGEAMHGTYRYTRVYTRLASGAWKITNFEVTRVNPRHGPVSDGPPDEQH